MKTIFKRIFRSQAGFTLIELLAVMAILAVLAGIVSAAVSGTKGDSIDAQVATDSQGVQGATDNFKTADISGGTTPFFSDVALNSARLKANTTIVRNPYLDVFETNSVFDSGSGASGAAEAGRNVILRKTDSSGISTGETLGDKVIPPGDVSGTRFLFTVIDFSSLDAQKIKVNQGTNVISATFVPNFLSKPPNSIGLKGDETSELGIGDETGGTRTGNTYEEFLWLYRVVGKNANESRQVEVYRLAEAFCNTGRQDTSLDPLADNSTGDLAYPDTTPATEPLNRVQVNADKPLVAYTSTEISNAILGRTAAGAQATGESNSLNKTCDTTNTFPILLVYDRLN